jgi:4-alpha-glucanotransferase
VTSAQGAEPRTRWGRRLGELARLYGIQTCYLDAGKARRRASAEALMATLRILGAPVESTSDIDGAIRGRRLEAWLRPLEPVAVAWNGRADAPIRLRLPRRSARSGLRCVLRTEDGGESDVTRAWLGENGRRRVFGEAVVDGRPFVELAMRPPPLPLGYHQLRVESEGKVGTSVIISAPRRTPPLDHRAWGVFVPLYALHTRRSWGVGDLTDLQELAGWVADLGGSMVSTLPILAAFLGESPFEPSPYAPVSRLFWNELHLDVTRIPELERSPGARTRLESRAAREQLDRQASEPFVDHRLVMAAKRTVLEELAQTFFDDPGHRHARFRAFLRTAPKAERYAAFRAACERRLTPWRQWPPSERDGRLRPRPGDLPSRRYHLYVQWQMAEQMAEVSSRGGMNRARLLFDLPLGAHPDGFDVWDHQDGFAAGASVGAPPDSIFSAGQNWAFPPPHPEAIRRQGYRYQIDSLRHVLPHSRMLRIDHVMGLHRLYWIPTGIDAGEGVYVRYRPEEWYAILALEANRTGTVIVGEDLGTVTAAVPRAMARHGLLGTRVVELEVRPEATPALSDPSRAAVAQVNTHDLPPFAGFWHGDDIAFRRAFGLLDRPAAAAERALRRALRTAMVAFLRRRRVLAGGADGARTRMPGPGPVVRALLDHLAAGPARMVLVNLEDLWLERRPQNVPGTTDQYPNWRRRYRHTFEDFSRMPSVMGTLARVNRIRRGEGAG